MKTSLSLNEDFLFDRTVLRIIEWQKKGKRKPWMYKAITPKQEVCLLRYYIDETTIGFLDRGGANLLIKYIVDDNISASAWL